MTKNIGKALRRGTKKMTKLDLIKSIAAVAVIAAISFNAWGIA
jgi:hypothetical protein